MSWERVSKFIEQDYSVEVVGSAGSDRVQFTFTVGGTHPTQGKVDYNITGSVKLSNKHEKSVRHFAWNNHCPDYDSDAVSCAAVLLAYMHGYITKQTFEVNT